MANYRKHLVTDEHMRPVAVQIDYADWLKIERTISPDSKPSKPQDLSRYAGVLELKDDPLDHQRRLRSEWP